VGPSALAAAGGFSNVSRTRDSLPWLAPVVAGLGVRLVGLQARPIWYDEAFSMLLAARPLPDVLKGTAADTMPPLYYMLLKAWQVLGSAIAVQRLLNVLLGVALIGLVFRLARELYGRRAGAWGAWLTAASPLLIYHAQELRMYTPLALTLGAAAYCFVVARRAASETRWSAAWVGFVAAGAAAMYTHNLALFSLAAFDLYLLARREWRTLGRLLGAQAVMVLLFLPWLLVVPGQIAKIQSAFWTPRPGLLEVIQAIFVFHAWLPLPEAWLPLGLAVSLLGLALTAYLSVRGVLRASGDRMLLTLIVGPPTLLFVASYLMRPLFVPRAFLLSLLAYLVLAGRAIAEARPRILAMLLAGAFILSSIIGVSALLSHDTFPRSPFGEAAAYLRSTRVPGDIVVHDNKLSFFPMHVYAPELPQVFLPDEPGSHNDTLAPATQWALGLTPAADVESAVGGADRVRYVVFQRALDEYVSTPAGQPPALTWLESHATGAIRVAFNDLWIYDFDL